MGITYARSKIRVERIVVEGDSATIIIWIQDAAKQPTIHPLIHDIRKSLRHLSAMAVRHVYRKANSAADWMAFFVADHTGEWSWHLG